MECIHIGSKIITLAIQMHGAVIDLDLSPEIAEIFEGVRLFSNAGEFEHAITNIKTNFGIKSKIRSMFQTDLTQSTLSVMNEYISHFKPEYTREVSQGHSSDLHLAEKSCKIYSNITVDKAWGNSLSSGTGSASSGILTRCFNYLNTKIEGVYLVSIHDKKDETYYELLYPKLETDRVDLNLTKLDDLRIFANIFGSELPNLSEYSTVLPNPFLYIDDDKRIENDPTLTDEEKQLRIQALKDEFYSIRNRWKLTIKNDIIEAIKMSVLVDLIKNIVGPTCKINLFDFTCNSISTFTPETQRSAKQFVISDDIEQGVSKEWGGRKKPKKMKKLKFPMRYLPKTLSKKDKKTQIKMLKKSKKQYKKNKYYTRKPLQSYKSKTSNHILNARKIYNIKNITPNAELAQKTGCKLSALKQIVKKGEGAYYSSGSRPNQTAKSWGLARLASSLTSGKAAAVDYDIIEKGCDHKKKAFILANKSRKKYKYGHSKTKIVGV